MIGMLRTVTNVWTLQSERKTFKSLDERCFQAYVTDVLGFKNDRQIKQVLDAGHIKLLKVRTKKYEAFEEEKQDRVVVGHNELKSRVEDYCTV